MEEINEAAARVARQAADDATSRDPSRPRFVAGSIGPTRTTLSLSPDVEDPAFRSHGFDEIAEGYRLQIEGLEAGGVDVLLAETVFDTLTLKACLHALQDFYESGGRRLPLMISVTGHGPQRPHPVRPDRRGLLVLGGAGAGAAQHRRQLLPRTGRYARLRGGSGSTRAGVRHLPSERRAAERARPLRGDPGRGLLRPRPVRAGGSAQHGRWLLRNDAEAHPGPGRIGVGGGPAGAGCSHGPRPLQRSGTAGGSPGLELHPGRRTDQRHRLSPLRAPAPRGRLRRGRGGGAAAGPGRRQHPRRQHGRGAARLGGHDADLPEPHRRGARHRRPAGDDRQLRLRGHRGGPALRAGQGDRQLHQPEGGRGGLPPAGAHLPALRRRRGGHGLRRARPGGHRRPPPRDLRTGLAHPRGGGRIRPGRPDLRSQHPHRGHGHGGTRRVRPGLPRIPAPAAPSLPRGQAVGGREQRLLLLPRQRHRAPGHALGPALPRDPGGPGHGHRQRRPAGPVRGHPLRLARARGGRAAGPAVRRHGPPAGLRRGTEARGGPPPGARRGGLAPGAAGAAPGPRPAPRTHGVPRGGSRGGPGPLRRAPEDHRGAAHGRHEPRGRPLRGGQDVPAAGGQVGPGDEAGRGPPGALDGRPGTKRAKGPGAAHEDRDGHGPGRRPRHRQEHRRGSCCAVTTSTSSTSG